jgi:hypothetical protein
MRWLAGLLLVAHGLIHLAVWVAPFDPAKTSFNPSHSWLLAGIGLESRARPIAIGLSTACAVMFNVAGFAVLGQATWAPSVAIVGAVLSLLLTTAYFHPWLSINAAINAAIVVIARSTMS